MSLNTSSVSHSFASFVAEYGRTYAVGSEEYELRREIYEHRFADISSHNSQPHRLWDAAVNHMTDRTDAELSRLRGLIVMRTAQKNGATSSIVEPHRDRQFLGQIKSAILPEEVSWANLHAIKMNTNQGSCGSCWAVATATMLQANAEIQGYQRSFSAQELVSCVPNPFDCGGTGGCQGNIAEIAMHWVVENGLATDAAVPYAGVNSKCQDPKASLLYRDKSKKKYDASVAVGFHAASKLSQGAAIGLYGWERLPQNSYEPLMLAVAFSGPVTVSVGAQYWHWYGGGIFNSCGKDVVIDHAVTLYGYGKDKKSNENYWSIKNSWGLNWGEKGNIRLLRHEGVTHCGTDYEPGQGTGCKGGPSTVKVCGMCGILYDNVIAFFKKK